MNTVDTVYIYFKTESVLKKNKYLNYSNNIHYYY